uniref:Uncharacterized protein n=1 Tax=Arundo donax TaxID=35708 RepID=A0A0A8Y334_ARUDO
MRITLMEVYLYLFFRQVCRDYNLERTKLLAKYQLALRSFIIL